MRFGYASAPEPEDLQDQVEALEDEQIPTDRQYVEIINRGHADRTEFCKLCAVLQTGDEVVIRDFSALGSGLLDAYRRMNLLDSMNISICVKTLPRKISQAQLLETFEYLGDIFERQKALEPTGGKPRKCYPVGWRDAFWRYKAGECTASETYIRLGIKEYDFFRMLHRYENAIEQRNSERKNRTWSAD